MSLETIVQLQFAAADASRSWKASSTCA